MSLFLIWRRIEIRTVVPWIGAPWFSLSLYGMGETQCVEWRSISTTWHCVFVGKETSVSQYHGSPFWLSLCYHEFTRGSKVELGFWELCKGLYSLLHVTVLSSVQTLFEKRNEFRRAVTNRDGKIFWTLTHVTFIKVRRHRTRERVSVVVFGLSSVRIVVRSLNRQSRFLGLIFTLLVKWTNCSPLGQTV